MKFLEACMCFTEEFIPLTVSASLDSNRGTEYGDTNYEKYFD